MAVKFDPPIIKGQVSNSNVLTECLLMKNNAFKIPIMPKYIMHATIGGRRFLIMEYLDTSLEDALNKNPGMFPNLALQMFNAIKCFHENGYVHRDLKPENMRLKDGRLYLIDFGCFLAADRIRTLYQEN